VVYRCGYAVDSVGPQAGNCSSGTFAHSRRQLLVKAAIAASRRLIAVRGRGRTPFVVPGPCKKPDFVSKSVLEAEGAGLEGGLWEVVFARLNRVR
jgi:hypothetical protein